MKRTLHTSLNKYVLILLIAGLAAGCSAPPKVMKKSGKTPQLVRLGKNINSTYDDFAPQLTDDGAELVFTSNRPLKTGADEIDRLYVSRRGEDGLSPASFAPVTTNHDTKVGAVAYDFVNNEVYFVQCYTEDGLGDCDIYVADLDGFQWKNVRNAGPVINSMEWDAHPTVSRDGETLYFASERTGNSDIWMSKRRSNGSWSEPQNLGPPINTGGDEKSPFISNTGEYLYFSSDDHPGYGGMDLFRAKKRGRGWMEPLNMGIPYNSQQDDIFFTTTLQGDTTYLASNRGGGIGGYDVYEIRDVELKEIAPREEKPVVPEKKPLVVRYTVKNAFTSEIIQAYVTYSAKGAEDIDMQSIPGGSVQHEVVPGKEYTVTASSSGFENGVEKFFYPFDEEGVKEREIFLTPNVEDEQRIYSFVVEFDFDLFNIRPEEKKYLDSAAILLTKHPNSKVVASGHTDSLGTVMYNIKLGYNRAKQVSTYVKRYLRKKGVKLVNPMVVRTYGESQPVDTNETDEGRQRNRRVEIGIIRMQ